MRLALAFVLLPLSAFALAPACSSGDENDGAGPSAQLTYQRDVRPIVEKNCVSCHSAEGGAPFSMVYDPAEWQNGPPAWAESAAAAVASGRMPPWMPDEETCRPLKGSRKLAAEQVRAFADWQASGFAKGDEASYVAPAATVALADDLGPPTFEAAPAEAYQPNRDQPDDYRCFFLPLEFAQETYLTGSTVVPGERSMVHHVLLYLVPPAEVARAAQLDAADPGIGYTCFGGPGGGSTNVGGWVPGSVPQRTPAGSALIVPAGARIVMQVHYNVLSQPTDRPLPSDLTRAALWAMPAGQKPTHRVEVLPLAHLDLSIAPGDSKSVQERVFTLPMGGELVSATAHMHLRGTRIRAQLEPAGAPPACLLDIPSWDFNWQQAYALPDDGFVPVKAGDKVRLTCEYDNTKENQPVVNGQQEEPRQITWGEGTLDEMCLMYVSVRAPFEQVPARCGGFAACASACPPGSGDCFVNCSIDSGGQCPSCLLPGVARCALPHCPLEGLALQQCLAPCGTTVECLKTTCAAQSDAFFGCMAPHVAAGECDADVGACGAK
jgi:copper type II ascorbate-dependent monooxygenase-like protein